eukprot:CAMPEP_0118830408 /NCGR_PEP_ID=MMETSP1162-20130426/27036_1 /TAXON_ID=33656 /ORGANISM="Phaeocystis Sp, Strain CCMP2710" /LENGTH=119 /DNA_ID=CAMNT_0006761725 /DNA_START=136 /DNA_END=491 /DNA_ORIENTATION=+
MLSFLVESRAGPPCAVDVRRRGGHGAIGCSHRGHARGAQPKARCASGASGARPTQGLRKAPCGAPARFGIFEGEPIVATSAAARSPRSASSSQPQAFQPSVWGILRYAGHKSAAGRPVA